jgi:hypothetical protein
VRPNILPFGTTGSGTSLWTTSPSRSSSSASRKRTSSIDKVVSSNKLAVKNLIEKIELESEENCKKEEAKKNENEKKLIRKTMMKKKEDNLDLKVVTKLLTCNDWGRKLGRGHPPPHPILTLETWPE